MSKLRSGKVYNNTEMSDGGGHGGSPSPVHTESAGDRMMELLQFLMEAADSPCVYLQAGLAIIPFVSGFLILSVHCREILVLARDTALLHAVVFPLQVLLLASCNRETSRERQRCQANQAIRNG